MSSIDIRGPSNVENKDLNTPVTNDGIGPIPRNLSSHEQNGFVVFIDVLGVKGITARMNPDRVFDLWRNIIIQFVNSLQNSSFKYERSNFRTLSDTILITIECSPDNTNSIFGLVMNPFLYSMESRLFLRGAIGYGKYYLSPRMMIGPAIDQAAACHDQLNWIGISATNSLSNYILRNKLYSDTDLYIFNSSIPAKKNDGKGFVLNWPKFANNKTIQILSEEHRKQTEPSVREKYVNTLCYYDQCTRNSQNR